MLGRESRKIEASQRKHAKVQEMITNADEDDEETMEWKEGSCGEVALSHLQQSVQSLKNKFTSQHLLDPTIERLAPH